MLTRLTLRLMCMCAGVYMPVVRPALVVRMRGDATHSWQPAPGCLPAVRVAAGSEHCSALGSAHRMRTSHVQAGVPRAALTTCAVGAAAETTNGFSVSTSDASVCWRAVTLAGYAREARGLASATW